MRHPQERPTDRTQQRNGTAGIEQQLIQQSTTTSVNHCRSHIRPTGSCRTGAASARGSRTARTGTDWIQHRSRSSAGRRRKSFSKRDVQRGMAKTGGCTQHGNRSARLKPTFLEHPSQLSWAWHDSAKSLAKNTSRAHGGFLCGLYSFLTPHSFPQIPTPQLRRCTN